jgi:hypothetical protein
MLRSSKTSTCCISSHFSSLIPYIPLIIRTPRAGQAGKRHTPNQEKQQKNLPVRKLYTHARIFLPQTTPSRVDCNWVKVIFKKKHVARKRTQWRRGERGTKTTSAAKTEVPRQPNSAAQTALRSPGCLHGRHFLGVFLGKRYLRGILLLFPVSKTALNHSSNSFSDCYSRVTAIPLTTTTTLLRRPYYLLLLLIKPPIFLII